jgi:hypothetical protein
VTACCVILKHPSIRPLSQLYSALERQIQSDAFADALARSQHELQQHPPVSAAAPLPGNCEVLPQDWWEVKEDGELRGEQWGGTG